MNPHRSMRVVKEKQALDEKLVKLKTFLVSEIFSTLPKEDCNLLLDQSGVMEHYSQILEARIARFKS